MHEGRDESPDARPAGGLLPPPAGLSQVVLAELVGKTVSWIEKIESGRANLQMLPNIVRLAQVLDIAPAELLPDDIAEVDATTHGRSVPALRQRLMSYRFVNPAFLAQDTPPVTLPQLARAVGSVWSAYQASRFGYVVAEMCPLIQRSQVQILPQHTAPATLLPLHTAPATKAQRPSQCDWEGLWHLRNHARL